MLTRIALLVATFGAVGAGCAAEPCCAVPECVRAAPCDEPPRVAGPIGVLAEADGEPVVACFDPDFPPSREVQDALERAMAASAAGAVSDRFVLRSRWPGSGNSPVSLSWSFVPDGTIIPAATGIGDVDAPSELFARMDEKFGGDRALWIAQFEAVFARWSQLVGVDYQRVTFDANPWDDGAAWGSSGLTTHRGDIRIGMKAIDGGFGILAYNGYPTSSDMVLDSAENWAAPANSYRYLRNTVAHEHGHGLGLAHVCPRNNTKLMEPYLSTVFDGPQEDEIRALHNYYGDPYEPNASANTTSATSLGTLAVGGSLTPSTIPAPSVNAAALTSIGLSQEVDHYWFTVAAPAVVSITVAPVGTNYADYIQDTACNNTTPITDALRRADLAFDLLNSSGTVIRTASATGFGAAESLLNYLLSPSNTYFVKVRAVNSPDEPQLYTLTISGAAESFTASDGAFTDRIRLSWGAITGVTAYRIYRGATANRAAATLIAQPAAADVQFDDTTAAQGTFFYWLEATTTGITGTRPAAGPESGFRATGVSNDACSGALAIVPGAPVGFNNSVATTDGPAENLCGVTSIASDLWFLYTPQSSGLFTVRTCGSAFDTRLAVYGSACPAGADTALSCSDNSPACPGGAGTESSLRVSGVAGQAYRIRVGAPSAAATGAGQLQVFCPGDFNLSGSITLQDVFDFLAAYFAESASADVDASGSTTVQDVFVFLAAYFAAC